MAEGNCCFVVFGLVLAVKVALSGRGVSLRWEVLLLELELEIVKEMDLDMTLL